MNTSLLTNARIVTPTENFIGSLKIEDGIITDIVKDKIYRDGVDLHGQWLIPGCIDIHTDYLEKELHPRPGADFPLTFALHFFDARAAACGITTVFSAISFSDNIEKDRNIQASLELASQFDAVKDSLLVKHFLHARIDPNSNSLLDYLPAMAELESLYLVVYNDTIPAQRQYTMEFVVERNAKRDGISKEEAHRRVLQRIEELKKINHRAAIQEVFSGRSIIGSHDDTTIAHVEEGLQFGATLSEMPTTIEAARKARELGLYICMGAPNYYRGGSHCGNLSCKDALEEGLVDILCSDYHFPTMLASVVRMIGEGIDPSKAVNLVSFNPAKLLEMEEETGSIQPGRTADLVAFDIHSDIAAVSQVYVDGVNKLNAQYGRGQGTVLSENRAYAEKN